MPLQCQIQATISWTVLVSKESRINQVISQVALWSWTTTTWIQSLLMLETTNLSVLLATCMEVESLISTNKLQWLPLRGRNRHSSIQETTVRRWMGRIMLILWHLSSNPILLWGNSRTFQSTTWLTQEIIINRFLGPKVLEVRPSTLLQVS
jgi:hypothetical protein